MNVKILLFFLLNIVQVTYSQVNAVKDSVPANLKKQLKRPIFQNYNSLISLEVKEVYEPWETCEPFSDDIGWFSYCGEMVGGIKNLLQTEVGSTPHLRFVNQPPEARKVYFHGIGTNVRVSKSIDFTNCFNDSRYFDCRALILKIMAEHFNFDVHLIEDSLNIVTLLVEDSIKLYHHQITYEEFQNKEINSLSEIQQTSMLIHRNNIKALSWIFEQKWNLYFEDKISNTISRHFFLIKIPKELIGSEKKYLQLKKYLEENYGLTLVINKKLRKVYEITFNE